MRNTASSTLSHTIAMLVSFLTLSCNLFAAENFDGPKTWSDRLSIDGKGYIRYSRELGSSVLNEFNIDRIYLGLNWKLGENTKARYLLEGGDLREVDSTGAQAQFDMTTKQFFLEVKDLVYSSSFLRLGQADLTWVGYIDGLWGYRIQGTNFTDRSGYLTSTDLGLAMGGNLPEKYGGFQLNIANGEGWKKREIGKLKEFHARLTVNPFASVEGGLQNIFVAAGTTIGNYDGMSAGVNNKKRRYNLLGGFKKKGTASLFAEYLSATDPASKMKTRYPSVKNKGDSASDARGFAVYAAINASVTGMGDDAQSWELLARWDGLDPDNAISDNNQNRWIAGLSHEWNPNILSLIDYEVVINDAGATLANERRIMFQTEVKF